jgi:hypothetical protein
MRWVLLVWLAGLVITLVIADRTVQIAVAALLLVVALPLVKLVQQWVKHQFWHDVEITISASGEPDQSAPSSGLD